MQDQQQEDAALQGEEGDVVAAMSDRDVLEKLIVVTPSRGVKGGAGGSRLGGLSAALDNTSSRLIADGLAMYEQELAEVRG